MGEFVSVTMVVVGAHPHAKEKDLYVHIPAEFGEAAKGYDRAMHWLPARDLDEDRVLLKFGGEPVCAHASSGELAWRRRNGLISLA